MNKSGASLLRCIIAPIAVGAAAALLSAGGMADFAKLDKPPLTPPGWIFPVVWTILYALMGISYYLAVSADGEGEITRKAKRTYTLQLAVNFFWPIFFFNFKLYLFSFVWLILLWILILKCIMLFCKISPLAAKLLIPYILWVSFAGYLNFGVYYLS